MVKNVYVKRRKGDGAFLKRANRYKGKCGGRSQKLPHLSVHTFWMTPEWPIKGNILQKNCLLLFNTKIIFMNF